MTGHGKRGAMQYNLPKISKTFSVAVFLIIIINSLATAQKFGEVTEEEWNMAPPPQYPEAEAVVIFDNGDMEISIYPARIKLERHIRIKVFNNEAAKEAAKVEIPYHKGDNIKGLKAYTIYPDGKKKKVKDFFRKKAGEYMTLTFAFPAVEDGAILEYKYRHTHQRFSFLDPWYFQGDIFTLRSRFSVALYPGFTYNAARKNIPAQYKNYTEEECRFLKVSATKYTWEVENIMPAKDEPLMGARNDNLASLYFQLISYRTTYSNFSFGKSWDEHGKFFDEIFTEFVTNEDQIKRLADSICADAPDEEGKIKRLFKFVRDEIDTRKDIDEEGNLGKTLGRKYGSVTEKNLLLVELLRALEIKAYPLYIGTRDRHGAFNPHSPQLNQLNRVICCIENDEDTLALDTDEEWVIYPFLPSYDLVEGGLLIDGDSSRTISLNYRERKSGTDIISNISVREDGSAICSTNIYIKGYKIETRDKFMKASLSQDEIAEEFLDKTETQYDVLEAASYFDSDGDKLWFDLVVELPEFATVSGENMFFSPVVIPIVTNRFTSNIRVTPVDFRYPFVNRQRISVCLPENMKIADVPSDLQHTIPGGRFSRTTLGIENVVSVKADFAIDKPVFSTGEYAGLKEMYEIVEASCMDQVAAGAGQE